MSFKNYLLVESTSSYGVPHLEDLPVDEMMRLLKRLRKLKAVQKLDGANLRCGVDLEGRVYTSREQKGGDRFYDSGDFPKRSAYDGFKSATLALFAVKENLKQALKPGQEISVEVIFGEQPNTVIYGKDGLSYIAFLEGSPGDDPTNQISDEQVDELAKLLRNKKINVKSMKHETSNGSEMTKLPIVTTWAFTSSDKVPKEKLENPELDKAIKKLETFLDKQSVDADKVGEDITVYDLLLSKDSKLKDAKEKAHEKFLKLVEPIKAILLKISKGLSPSIKRESPDDKTAFHGTEGLIFKDPETKETFKVVDKDEFTKLNKFNYAVRNKLVGKILTGDLNASLESRGGYSGTAKIRCINLFGIKGAEAPSQAYKALEQFAEQGEDEGMAALEKAFSALSLEGIKRKCGAIYTHALHEVEEQLEKFNNSNPSEDINGTKYQYTPEIKRRTLLTFAETIDQLNKMLVKIRKAESLSKLFVSLVGKGAFKWDR